MKTLLTIISFLLVALGGAKAEDKGFIHPGGLHTQEDFDRVKAQLAAGNETVKQAYNVLRTAAYAQSGAATYPSEAIVRGGSGENYINAARGAAIAYQNALRWKIEGNNACAKHAVNVLMQWARTTKYVTGTSDQCLARGLYGYQFAQAAELMRDYEGWAAEDFEIFKQWMLTVWYPGAIQFLRVRNGTWENIGKWWQAPGHYWSNWGLCNTLCVAMIGILCDDVFIYNQAMSFFKYDQCGTFTDPRTEVPIKNSGLTEFLGNLVVTTEESELETGAYGKLGQMNESGRDTGHSAMALGLAVDVAKVGWNQGDDLFAYMSHRLAAGIEYVAAQTQSIENLPWVNYHYASNGYYYTDSRSWIMTGPALGAQMRPYWGTVIGIYEGVKGVTMPYSEVSYQNMGIDEGGQGGTSGGYDHLGYSVLMNTRNEQLCPTDKVPTELSPKMEYSGSITTNLIPSLSQERTRGMVNGNTILHSELGGLVNTYTVNNKTSVPEGQTVKLMPQLPNGETDTGLWQWNTGEETRDITVSTDRSYIYRATYTNQNGVKSQIAFSIAAQGDCSPTIATPSITYKGEITNSNSVTIFYGESVTLSVSDTQGFGTYAWSNGRTGTSITLSSVTATQDITCTVTNQGGRQTSVTFHIEVIRTRQEITVDENTLTDTASIIVNKGSDVTFTLNVPPALSHGTAIWEDGSEGFTYPMPAITESQRHTLTYTLGDDVQEYTFDVTVLERDRALSGNYVIRHRATGLLLTSGTAPYFTQGIMDGDLVDASQQWAVTSTGRYTVQNQDGKYISGTGKLTTLSIRHYITFLASTPYAAICSTTNKYWQPSETQTLQVGPETELTDFAFEIIPVGDYTAIRDIKKDATPKERSIYDMSGRKTRNVRKGSIYIIDGKKRMD
jgi:hypothetical protein